MPETKENEIVPVKRKPGRPSKAALEKAKKPGKVGRPPGSAARIEEFKARLLSTSGDRVIETVIRKALDDTDKDQAAMLKMCMDRILPLSLFDKGAGKSNAVSIQIINTTDKTEINGNSVDSGVVDVDFEEVGNE